MRISTKDYTKLLKSSRLTTSSQTLAVSEKRRSDDLRNNAAQGKAIFQGALDSHLQPEEHKKSLGPVTHIGSATRPKNILTKFFADLMNARRAALLKISPVEHRAFLKSGWLPFATTDDRQYSQVIEMRLDLAPQVKQRASVGRGHGYNKASTDLYEKNIRDFVALHIKKHKLEPFLVPMKASFAFVFEGPVELSPVGPLLGDISNLVKAVEDGMNQVSYSDDRLICELGPTVKISGTKSAVYIRLEAARAGKPAWLDKYDL